MGLVSRVSSRTYRNMDINNWVNNKGGFAFKEPTLPNSLSGIPARTGEKSIAESRAESRSTYRSITSKVDRRRIKRQALLDKLQYEADQKKNNNKNGGEVVHFGPASAAQADIGMHYIEKKKQERRQNKKESKTNKNSAKTKTPEKLSSDENLKQVKKNNNKFKKGHQAEKHKKAIMQIQKMQARIAKNDGQGAISEMLN